MPQAARAKAQELFSLNTVLDSPHMSRLSFCKDKMQKPTPGRFFPLLSLSLFLFEKTEQGGDMVLMPLSLSLSLSYSPSLSPVPFALPIPNCFLSFFVKDFCNIQCRISQSCCVHQCDINQLSNAVKHSVYLLGETLFFYLGFCVCVFLILLQFIPCLAGQQ